MNPHILSAAVAITASSLSAQAGSSATAKLLAPGSTSVGSTVEIPLELTPAETLHFYYINPGEMGQPVGITWTEVPEGFTFGELRFPVPHRVKTGELATNGYEEATRFFSQLTIDSSVKPGTYSFKGKVSWLACNDSKCIPGSQEVDLQLAVIASGEDAAPEESPFAEDLLLIPVDAADWQASIQKKDETWVIDLTKPTDWEQPTGKLDLFSETSDFFQPGVTPAITSTEKGLQVSVPASEYSDEVDSAKIVLVGPTPPLRISIPSILQKENE